MTIGSTHGRWPADGTRTTAPQPGLNRSRCYLRPRTWPTSPASRRRSSAPILRRPTTHAGRGCSCIGAAIAGVALGFVAVAALRVASVAVTPTRRRATEWRLPAARSRSAPALAGDHSIQSPAARRTSGTPIRRRRGPHFGIAAIFGIYDEPLELARIVHNLEHGGIFILYGDDVPEETVNELRGVLRRPPDRHGHGPARRLGDEFALGAWVVGRRTRSTTAFLAKCTTFDEDAVSTFFRALQFHGPERFDPEHLQPGL